MFMLIFLLALAGVYVEIKLVTTVPTIGQYLERYRLLSLAFSLGLSVLLGSLFGAAGLIVFAAGILSTVMIQPWYALRKNGTMERMAKSYASHKASLIAHKQEVIHRLNQLAKLAVFAGRMILLPIKILFVLLDAIEKTTDWLATTNHRRE